MNRFPSQGSISIAISIVLAGAIIAGTLLLVDRSGSSKNNRQVQATDNADFRRLEKEDHLRGNPNAPVTIVEFSDFECPFCSRLHPTLERIVKERPEDVNWVFRHFPLTSIHSRALGSAVASECVARLSGNEAFWTFTDRLFADQRNLGPELYERAISDLGIDQSEFEECLEDKDVVELVSEDNTEAERSGGRGTPHSVVITANDSLVPFSGAIPYEQINQIIDQALTS